MKSKQTKKVSPVLLPAHVLPDKYAVTLRPDLESATYTGKETVHLTLVRPDKSITMHASELEVVSAVVVLGKKELWTSKISYNQKQETVTFWFPKALPKGKVQLTVEFRGVLNDKLRGYYRSSYTHQGKQKHIATTQFEPTDARRAFPCFDEPNRKAVFSVTLIVPNGHEAISNTLPALVKEHEAGFKAVTFKPTPKMSTYLLAFVSGEFDRLEKKTKSGVLVRAFTTPGKSAQAKFSLGVAVRVVEFFEKYFDIRYPLPVLDLLAIPDFSAGAMENWGAITFRETAMLVDEATSGLSNKQWVALVVAHEVAHQWFGNLVTMDWWTHLWLNEGFASYMEYVAIDHVFPEWSIWTQFMTLEYTKGVTKDQLASSHPIEVAVQHPSEIDEIFDDISYRKGSSIIRMLASYLGEKDFRLGLSQYLKRHAYKNATTEDLWTSLEKASKKPVRSMMSAWTKQVGLPVLSFREEAGETVLSQERFLINPDEAKQKRPVTLWPIPISWEHKGKRENMLFTAQHTVMPFTEPRKLNIGETGFYRVAYTPAMLDILSEQCRAKALPPLDRWGVIHNAWVMAEAGMIDLAPVLDLCVSLRGETDYTVLSEVLSGLVRVGRFARGEKYEKQFAALVRSVCEPSVRRLSWQQKMGESHGDRLLRELVLLVSGLYGDEAVLVRALQEFKKIVRGGDMSVDINLRETVYRLTASVGGAPEWTYFKKRYQSEHSHEEQERLAAALASFTSPKLLAKTLLFAFSKDVRTQDFPIFCREVSLNAVAGSELWKFIKMHWSEILHRYGGNFLLSKTIASLSQLSSVPLEKEIAQFFRTKPRPGAERTLVQALEHIHTAALWRVRSQKQLPGYLGGK